MLRIKLEICKANLPLLRFKLQLLKIKFEILTIKIKSKLDDDSNWPIHLPCIN
jgi:hypothetical protein